MFQCYVRQIFPTCTVEVPYVQGDILPNWWVSSVLKTAFNRIEIGAPYQPPAPSSIPKY